MKFRSSMIGCVASTTSSSPRRPRGDASRHQPRVESFLLLPHLGAFLRGVAVPPAAESPSDVSHVDCASVAPKMTRVCPRAPWRSARVRHRDAHAAIRHLTAEQWQKDANAALVAEYVAWPGAGHFTAMDPTATTVPSRRRASTGGSLSSVRWR